MGLLSGTRTPSPGIQCGHRRLGWPATRFFVDRWDCPLDSVVSQTGLVLAKRCSSNFCSSRNPAHIDRGHTAWLCGLTIRSSRDRFAARLKW